MSVKTGYNESDITLALKKLQDAFNDFEDAFIRVTQNQFVDKIANSWYSEEAVNFFKKTFKPQMEGLNESIVNKFNEMIDILNTSGKEWSKITGGTFIGIRGAIRKLNFNIAGIMNKDSNGASGIDSQSALDAAKTLLNSTYPKVAAALNKAKIAISTSGSSGLIGGQQEDRLLRLLSTIEEGSLNSLNTLAKLIENDITTSVEKYIKVAQDNSNKISGLGAGLGFAVGGVASNFTMGTSSNYTSGAGSNYSYGAGSNYSYGAGSNYAGGSGSNYTSMY